MNARRNGLVLGAGDGLRRSNRKPCPVWQTCEALEPRRLLSIAWVNRGLAGDHIDAMWGPAYSAAARGTIDAAVAAWNRVVTNMNYQSIDSRTGQLRTQFDLTVVVDDTGTMPPTIAAEANIGPIDAFGKPTGVSIKLNRGSPRISGGYFGESWFFDPTPTEHSEFGGESLGAYILSGQPGGGQNDLFSTMVHEITHGLGIAANPALRINATPANGGLMFNTGVSDPVGGAGGPVLWTFTGPSIRHLVTTGNGGGVDIRPNHLARVGAVYTDPNFTVWKGSNNLLNDTVPGGRSMPDFVTSMMLKDAYGYTITSPAAFNTIYATRSAAGALMIRGTKGDDVVNLSSNGAVLTVTVDVADPAGDNAAPGDANLPAFVYLFDTTTNPINSIRIETYAGNDSVTINGLPAGRPVVMETGIGNDTVYIESMPAGSPVNIEAGDGSDNVYLRSVPDNSPVTVNGGKDGDTLRLMGISGKLDDVNSAVTFDGGDDFDLLVLSDFSNPYDDPFAVTATTVVKPYMVTVTRANVETIAIDAGAGANAFTVSDVPAGVTARLNGNAGNDTLANTGGTLVNWLGRIDFFGGDGVDAVNLNDSAGTVSNTFVLNTTTWTRTRTDGFTPANPPVLDYTFVEKFNGLLGGNNDRLDVSATSAGVDYTFDTGAGLDLINLGNGTSRLDTIAPTSTLALNGGEGTGDELRLLDGNAVAAASHTLSATAHTRAGVGATAFAAFEIIRLSGGNHANTYNVTGVAAGTSVNISGDESSDTFNIGFAGSLDPINGPLSLTGNGGGDAVNLNGQNDGGALTHTLGAAAYTGPVAGTIAFGTIESIVLNCGSGADTVTITPSDIAAFVVNFSSPTPPTTPGDKLMVDLAGVVGATNAPSGVGSGRWTFSNRLAVDYTGAETVIEVGGNAPPIIGFFIDDPDPIVAGGTLLLYAGNVTDDGTVAGVRYYLETNNISGLQIDQDQFVGEAGGGPGDWNLTRTTGSAPGTFVYYAVARDNLGLSSAPATTTSHVLNAPPFAYSLAYIWNNPVPQVVMNFNENVGPSLSAADFTIINRRTGASVSPTAVVYYSDIESNIAVVQFTGGLPDGDYRMTLLAAGVVDANGLAMSSNITLDFFALAGDTNRDRKVDFTDLVVLAQNYGTTGKTFSKGNFNLDAGGNVSFADLVILAQRYGTTMPAPADVPAASSALVTSPVKRREKAMFSITRVGKVSPPKIIKRMA